MKHFFFIINFQKEKANTFTLLIILIATYYHKSATYYDPQSAGINVQSTQSESTPRRLTLPLPHLQK